MADRIRSAMVAICRMMRMVIAMQLAMSQMRPMMHAIGARLHTAEVAGGRNAHSSKKKRSSADDGGKSLHSVLDDLTSV